jgi:DNA uptake protein ComE-like DNA-binding protein
VVAAADFGGAAGVNRFSIQRLDSLLWSILLAFLLGACRPSNPPESSRWEAWEGCTLVPGRYFDGDSFPIRHAGRIYVLRLYFADAPETARAYERLLSEQADYFGVTPDEAIRAGLAAKEFTAKFLARPFRVITSGETAPGASRIQRRYAMVERDGVRLDAALVEAGLARATASTAPFPTQEEGRKRSNELRVLEQKAAHARLGLWAQSQRVDRRKTMAGEITQRLGFKTRVHQVNVNTATPADLQALPGVGPAGAAAIIRARPLHDLDELDQVPGFGARKIDALRDLVRFD